MWNYFVGTFYFKSRNLSSKHETIKRRLQLDMQAPTYLSKLGCGVDPDIADITRERHFAERRLRRRRRSVVRRLVAAVDLRLLGLVGRVVAVDLQLDVVRRRRRRRRRRRVVVVDDDDDAGRLLQSLFLAVVCRKRSITALISCFGTRSGDNCSYVLTCLAMFYTWALRVK